MSRAWEHHVSKGEYQDDGGGDCGGGDDDDYDDDNFDDSGGGNVDNVDICDYILHMLY